MSLFQAKSNSSAGIFRLALDMFIAQRWKVYGGFYNCGPILMAREFYFDKSSLVEPYFNTNIKPCFDFICNRLPVKLIHLPLDDIRVVGFGTFNRSLIVLVACDSRKEITSKEYRQNSQLLIEKVLVETEHSSTYSELPSKLIKI